MIYDYLIVGSGLFGSVFAYEAAKRGKLCLVIDKRSHVAGNLYCKSIAGITVHMYGPHIFHTNNEFVWNYINQFAKFNNFVNSPIAIYKSELYNLPFNMNTFYQMWGVKTPCEAKEIIREQIERTGIKNPKNLEEQAISLVGIDVYQKLIKGYTEKQWGCDCKDLPAFIIKRLPFRFTFNNNYFNDAHQGIPEDGYNKIIEKMIEQCDLALDSDYFEFIKKNPGIAEKIVFTGMIDEFFKYRFGALQYRSLHFEISEHATDNFQGNAVVNYTDREIPYTRIIEHKHFGSGNQPHTVISREYPCEWKEGAEPYYPINDDRNMEIYNRYRALAEGYENVIFGGRLGQYCYFDMDKVIENALAKVALEFHD